MAYTKRYDGRKKFTDLRPIEAKVGVVPRADGSAFFKIGSTFYGIVFSFIGGFVTALIATRKQFIHSLALSLLFIVIAIGAMNFTGGSHWSEWVNIFVIAPFAAIGGWLRVKLMK